MRLPGYGPSGLIMPSREVLNCTTAPELSDQLAGDEFLIIFADTIIAITMASMNVAKNSLFNISKSFPLNPSLPFRFCSTANAKITRVSFTSASKYSEGRNADEKIEETADSISEKTKNTLKETKNRASSMSDKVKDTVKEGMERDKEKAGEVKEKTREVAGSVADKAKQGREKATEMAQNIGEKTKQTVQNAWGAAMETGQKIKETVVGKDESDDEIEDLRRRVTDKGKKNDWK
ncbi:hypothetical protein NE237_000635 [Protea cynaroides]|uniref:Uncharacterized protein n=1 Tax=Protea cynaroides TaxID=273540 RepID=A0A9Q0KRY8_9MAGN|nr:hypothetical protein NE237_000635 [Protea cynaroides]